MKTKNVYLVLFIFTLSIGFLTPVNIAEFSEQTNRDRSGIDPVLSDILVGNYTVPGVTSSVPLNQVIKIGILGDMNDITGNHSWKGAMLAAREINEAGGIEPDIRYPDSTLTPSEAKMYRELRNRKSLEEFIKEAGDDILRQLRVTEQNGAKNPEKELFNSFVKKLSKENIVLSKDLIKLAIAQKTKDEADEYEHDPTIRFAINHLQALLLMSNG